jgi:hypothetical protein
MRGADNHNPQVVLASRKDAGIRVTLLWAGDTNTVALLVRDNTTNERFELVVQPDASPMDVYEHPYAYAAWRGIDYRVADLRQRPEQVKAVRAGRDGLPSGGHEYVILRDGRTLRPRPLGELGLARWIASSLLFG